MKFNRRNFLSVFGLAAAGVAVASPQAAKAVPVPKTPQVKSNRAYVTTVSGNDWHEITHGLDKPLVCAVAGDVKGNVIRAVLEPTSLSTCRLRVPAPPLTFYWRKPKKQSYSVVVYVPMDEQLRPA